MKALAAVLPMQLEGSEKTEQRSDQGHADYALTRAEVMFSCYRRDDAAKPEMYAASVAAVLAEYPKSVIEYVTDPRTGLPSKIKFLPNVAEVRSACEDQVRPFRYAEEWEAGARKQVAEREQLAVADHRPRKTYAQLQAELAEAGIFIGDQPKKPFDVKAFREANNITQEQWDAIPNAPERKTA